MRDIFLDLDGVVADLRWAQYSAHLDLPTRCPGPGKRPIRFPDHGTLDPEFEHWLHNPELWESGPVCSTRFWADMQTYDWTPRLLAALRSHGKVRVCSNPGRPAFAHHAAHGKVLWCQWNLGVRAKDITLMADKLLLAKPGRVLIDDDEQNISLWTEAGGVGILFPQAWNSNSKLCGTDVIGWITEQLK